MSFSAIDNFLLLSQNKTAKQIKQNKYSQSEIVFTLCLFTNHRYFSFLFEANEKTDFQRPYKIEIQFASPILNHSI